MTTVLEQIIAEQDAPAVWPERLPQHLSASQITMFERCPDQYRRRYMLGQVGRPGAAMVWGAADHYAHEQNFTQKIETGTDISLDDVKEAFAEGFERAIERNGGHTEVAWGDDKPDQIKDRGVELVAAYHRQVSPRVQPVAVESKFEIRVPGVSVPVVGYVDVTTAERGIERKTAKAKTQEPKPEWRIQGRLYQAVEHKPIEWHVATKTKTPGIYTADEIEGLLLPYAAEQVEAARRLVRSTARVIAMFAAEFGPDDPWPGALTHPWACGYCGFRSTCTWWAA